MKNNMLLSSVGVKYYTYYNFKSSSFLLYYNLTNIVKIFIELLFLVRFFPASFSLQYYISIEPSMLLLFIDTIESLSSF